MNRSEFTIVMIINIIVFGILAAKIIEIKGQRDVVKLPANPMIVIDTPAPDSLVTSPLKITGKAHGNWFFEASFPVLLKDDSNKTIAQSHATTKITPDDPVGAGWMTTDFVPFEATLTFQTPLSSRNGFLILKKDNPSGLPQYDDMVEIPVKFK